MTRGRFEPKLKQRLRRARAQQRSYELGPEWQTWVLENLARGASPEELLAALIGQGVPKVIAARAIAELRDSAVLRSIRATQERSRQLTHRAQVLTELRKNATQVERVPMLAEQEFFERYYATNTPVVFTELMKDWPALRRWTPEYFRDTYGQVEIEIVEGREGDPYCDRKHDTVKRITTMAAYAQRVLTAGRTNDFYFTARNRNIELEGLRSLNDDVRAPAEFFLPAPTKDSQSFWFGPEGSLTATHHDPTNILFCQVYGSKRLQLAPPTDVGVLMQAEGYYNKAIHDLRSYEGLQSSHILDVILSPGEALFIPALWWHRVEALSISISFSLLHFKRTNRYPDYRP